MMNSFLFFPTQRDQIIYLQHLHTTRGFKIDTTRYVIVVYSTTSSATVATWYVYTVVPGMVSGYVLVNYP